MSSKSPQAEPGGPTADSAGTLLSVNVGMPKDVPWQGKTVFTGVYKDSVSGARRVGKLNVEGDGQGDLAGHGGEQRAVFVYQRDSYGHWEEELGRDDFVDGQFGENFTIEGLGDDEVCVGDRYQIGDAIFEVTQPRVTCYRVGIRMNDPRIPALLVSHNRPGFYFRVLQEGEVQAGDEILKLASGPEQMTVAELSALLYLPGHPRQELLRALRIPALSAGWQASFGALLDGGPGGGNAGLAAVSPPPAWPGFRRLTVTSASSSTWRHRAAPRGTFILDATEAPVLLISAGIGATPVLAMLHALAEQHSDREVWWLHGARSSREHSFAAEARTLLASLPNVRSHVYYSRPGPEDLEGRDFDVAGRLAASVLAELAPARSAEAYLCGPASFMEEISAGLVAVGLQASRIHTEPFGPAPSLTPGIAQTPARTPHLPAGRPGEGPTIEFARSSLAVPWSEGYGSLLEFAEACDVPVRWSCRTGVCHTCETTLIAGELAYNPDPVEPPADGSALICCSRPSDDIVLDL